MAKYDLTWKVGEYFDRHFILPMIEFLSHREVREYFWENGCKTVFVKFLSLYCTWFNSQIYPIMDLVQAKADLAKHTNMVDVEMEAYEKLHNAESPGKI